MPRASSWMKPYGTVSRRPRGSVRRRRGWRIVVGLRTQRFLTAQVQNITPTERGLALFGVLERVDLVLVDPSVTAELKCLIDNVVTGRDAVLPCVIRLPIFVPFSVDWCYDTI